MKLKNVTVKRNSTILISGADGMAENGLVTVLADNPGLHASDVVQSIANGGSFDNECTYIDENPSGTLNFKID
jgi:hypothetical protein